MLTSEHTVKEVGQKAKKVMGMQIVPKKVQMVPMNWIFSKQ